MNINVLADYHRKGIGTSLLKVCVQEALALNRTVIETGTDHDSGRAFLKKHGAEFTIEAAENRLELEDVDWDMMQAWVDEGYPVTGESGYADVSALQAKDLIDNNTNIVVIDVSPFYDDGHIPGAINYYVGDGSLDEAIPTLDKDKDYLVYCHFDSASILGATKLVDAGFNPVYRLEGNLQAWIDAGYDIEP